MMGFDVIAFYDVDGSQTALELFGVPVLKEEQQLWSLVDSDTQFIVAVEYEQSQSRDRWLKNLATHNCRSVSVILLTRRTALWHGYGLYL